MNKKTEEEFNIIVGQRLANIRQIKKVSQDYLGSWVGVRGQQIHKYETGENNITVARLKIFARVLGVDINYFYSEDGCDLPRNYHKSVLNVAAEVHELDPEIRQGIYQLTRVINKKWHEKQEREESEEQAA